MTAAARLLGEAGIDAIYGAPSSTVDVVAAPAPVAELLCRAHERVHGRPAAVHRGDDVFELGRRRWTPGDGLPPRPAPVDLWPVPDPAVLARIEAAAAPMVLAGPGVVRAGAVAGLHAFAVAAGVGVLNTWGAKGVFNWRSRHHWATVGLQADDFELGGLPSADLVIAIGVDPLEAPPDRWQPLAPWIEVAPSALAPLAEVVRRTPRDLAMPPLRERLAAVTQAGWARVDRPVAPSRATLGYAAAIGAGGLLAADPGVAGYWVARTYGTSELGSVVVPAEGGDAGFAAACVLVARLRRPARPALAVVDGPIPPAVISVVETGRSLGVCVPVEAWTDEGDPLGPDEHERRVRELVAASEPSTASLAVEPDQLGAMIEAAGPIVAWT